jgi:hypothetical protein
MEFLMETLGMSFQKAKKDRQDMKIIFAPDLRMELMSCPEPLAVFEAGADHFSLVFFISLPLSGSLFFL